MTPGKLTIGADNPAYGPWFAGPAPTGGSVWQNADPNNGLGLEAATGYLIAQELGFPKADVVWAPVPFTNAIQPGPKAFDIYLTQVSYSADRAQAVDLSDGYFDDNQAIVFYKTNAITKVTTVAGLKDFKLGTQVGTTSLTYINTNIKPTKAASVYDTLDRAIAGLKAKQIDGCRGRPRDGLLRPRRRARQGRDLRAADDRRPGALLGRAQQGQQPHPVRQHGDRRPQGERGPGRPAPGVHRQARGRRTDAQVAERVGSACRAVSAVAPAIPGSSSG